MKYLILALLLSGCQLTLQRLPPPVEPDVSGALQQHAQALEVLVKDYNERTAKKK